MNTNTIIPKSMKRYLLLLFMGCFSFVGFAHLPKHLKSNGSQTRSQTKAENCAPATAIAQMDFNNVRARIENGGNMWQNRSNGTPFYEVPKNSGTHAIFAGALWMGGRAPNGALKVAAVDFRAQEDDFYPGPLKNDGTGEVTSDVCNDFDRFWSASKADALQHSAYWKIKAEQGDEAANEAFPNYDPQGPAAFQEWAAIANNPNTAYDKELAPYFDFDGSGDYNPGSGGDYPGYDLEGDVVCRDSTRRVPLFGDTTIYWIFNDRGNIHTSSSGEPIGMEIRAQAFAFADQTAINNMTFCNYVLINQGSQTLTNTYFGQWVDTDLGDPRDDYVGCDVQRGLAYSYNGDNNDNVTGGPSRGYGTTPPAVGIDFFQGPFQDNDGTDNYGPFDPISAPNGDSTVTYDEVIAGNAALNLGPNGIPYKGLGIGYGDGVIDNERFGMRKFIFYTNGGGATGDPQTAINFYGYLSGFWIDGSPFIYGGNAHISTNGNAYPAGPVADDAFCDFMFPAETDPVAFGSRGVDYPAQNGGVFWSEATAGNAPGDRRFLQSSGPFTLTPGQVNNITVGVVWARANAGNNLASVSKLKEVDDIAQSLFDNCFQIFEGPDAPDLDITELDQELILTLTNPITSNNFQEKYSKVRPDIPNDASDRTYEFEGYLVYQLKDETVSVNDLSDPELARLVSQSDVVNYRIDTATGEPNLEDPVSNLINYVDDPTVNLPVPTLMVTGSNAGVVKAIRVREDLFATGADRRLVNNKPYHFVAIAYGFNEYQVYNPSTNEGQFEPFVPSRKSATGGSIQSVSAIPHSRKNQNGGTVLNAQFGDQLLVTRLEGNGNGGNYSRVTAETEARIIAEPFAVDRIDYQKGFAPVNMAVIDPLNVVPADYTLVIYDTASGDKQNFETAYWELYVETENGRDTVTSDNTLDIGGQQLIFAKVGPGGAEINMGVALNIKQVAYDKVVAGLRPDYYTDPIGGDIRFENPSQDWLSGVVDTDGETIYNWIRAGNVTNGNYKDAVVSPSSGSGGTQGIDQLGKYENFLSRIWTAGRVLGSTSIPGDPSLYLLPREAIDQLRVESTSGNTDLSLYTTPSVDVVFTPNKELWTRCIVIEASDAVLDEQFKLKQQPSIDKNGRQAGDPGYVAAEGDLTNTIGMGWFPGYAIDVETGERLNMAYAEDSRFTADNGDDMLFNPTNRLEVPNPAIPGQPSLSEVIAGGRHYLYVLRNQRKIKNNDTHMPRYDYGAFAREEIGKLSRKVMRSVAWASIPLANPTMVKSYLEGYVPTTTRVELRLRKAYTAYAGATLLNNATSKQSSITGTWSPYYQISSEGLQPSFGNSEVVKNNFESIRAVPNPYYGYSRGYESDRLDNRIKFTNLPTRATIRIYTVSGTLIRQLEKDDTNGTIVEWDLKNAANIPISSGTYIIHIDMPGLGEHVIKWFGVMRDVDLQNL